MRPSILLILLVVIGCAEALKCYKAKTPSKKEVEVECKSKKDACMFDRNGKVESKGCEPLKKCKATKKQTKGKNKVHTCCTKDLCNTGKT